MNKKGFTLIELLAVIVILAIIALIATPAMLNVIEDAKESAAKDSARIISKSAETYYMSNAILKGEDIITIDLTSETIEWKGDKPSKGYVSFDNQGNAYLKMYINGYCVESNYDNTVTSTKEESKDCQINTVSVPLDLAGGTLDKSSLSYEEGDSLGELPTPTRVGYTFQGWYDGNGNGVDSKTVVLKGLKLNAQWEANKYEVTFKNGETVVETRPVTFGLAYGNLPTVTQEGYELEWQVNGITITKDTLVSTASNHEINANWKVLPVYFPNAMKVYFNPLTNTVCSNYVETNSANEYKGTSENGCLKWYVYAEEGDNKLLLLDHNTTNQVPWSSSLDVLEPDEAVKQLVDDTKGWVVESRLISANEIYKIAEANKTASSNWKINDYETYYYFTTGSSSVPYKNSNHTLGWLFDRTNGCDSYGCYTSDSSTFGYWTSNYASSGNAWFVFNDGYLFYYGIDSSYNMGVRPVIEVPKSLFTN